MLSILQQHRHLDLLLHKGETVALRNIQRGMEIECKQGSLWITRSGENTDYTLEPGEHYVPKQGGKVVIEAIDESTISLENQEHDLESVIE